MLGVVENMAGLRQRADAFRFSLPGLGGAAGSGKQQPGGGGSGSAAAEERDVTEQVLAALRQVDPSLEVGMVTTLHLVICLAGEHRLQCIESQAGVACTARSVLLQVTALDQQAGQPASSAVPMHVGCSIFRPDLYRGWWPPQRCFTAAAAAAAAA